MTTVGGEVAQITWQEVPQRYGANVHVVKIGAISCGTVFYSLKSKGEPDSYTYSCSLPGLKETFYRGKEPTIEEAKAKLEAVIRKWFELTAK